VTSGGGGLSGKVVDDDMFVVVVVVVVVMGCGSPGRAHSDSTTRNPASDVPLLHVGLCSVMISTFTIAPSTTLAKWMKY
jgi:hypothetical protein